MAENTEEQRAERKKFYKDICDKLADELKKPLLSKEEQQRIAELELHEARSRRSTRIIAGPIYKPRSENINQHPVSYL